MDSVVVWNLDARYRPELEVELFILSTPDEIPGAHLAALRPELEVEMIAMDDGFDEDGWFLAEDAIVPDDLVA